MTEDEAKQRWCPFVRLHGTPSDDCIPNRTEAATDITRCIGSACMAWRHSSPRVIEVTGLSDEAIAQIQNSPAQGFCGELVKRLRDLTMASAHYVLATDAELVSEAIDRIEALEAALKEIGRANQDAIKEGGPLKYGLLDCYDNSNQLYQSAHLANALVRAASLLSTDGAQQ